MGCLRAIAANEVIAKMKGPDQVTIKYLKKVEVGKRLAEYNRTKREELTKAQKSEAKLTSDQYYGTGPSQPLGCWHSCVYQSKKGDVTPVH